MNKISFAPQLLYLSWREIQVALYLMGYVQIKTSCHIVVEFSHKNKLVRYSNTMCAICQIMWVLNATARRERSLFTSLTFCKVIGSCSLRLNKRIHLYPFFCVSFIRVICYDQLALPLIIIITNL